MGEGRDPSGRLVVVCGPGGTGASVIAAALALRTSQVGGAGWATRDRTADADSTAGRGRRGDRPGGPRADSPARTLLADLALRADQAFLHGVDGPDRALLSLVDTARYRPITAIDARRCTVVADGFRLLPGLRRAAHWTAAPPGAFDVVLDGLIGIFDRIIADVTGDLEGERDSGSIDVEERNHLARSTTRAADVVVVVGRAGGNGTRRLALLLDDLLDHGVDPARILPVVNQVDPAPPGAPPPLARMCGLPAAPIGLPVIECLGARLPPLAVGPVADTVTSMLARLPVNARPPVIEALAPGSLGCCAP